MHHLLPQLWLVKQKIRYNIHVLIAMGRHWLGMVNKLVYGPLSTGR